MPYPKTEPKADFPKLEHEILAFWRADNTFHKSLNKTKLGHPFSFRFRSMTGHRLEMVCRTGGIWAYPR